MIRPNLTALACFPFLCLPIFAEEPQSISSGRTIRIDRAYLQLHERASMAFDRPGTITKLHCKLGDFVKRDDMLVQLDDLVAKRTHAIAVEKARSTVGIEQAKLVYHAATLELETVVKANENATGTYSATDVERLRIEAEKARLQLEKAAEDRKAAILARDQSEAELRTYQIRAPFDGFISAINFSQGDSVHQGEITVELVDRKKVRVQAYVPYTDAWAIRPGDPITARVTDPEITVHLHNMAFNGKLEFVKFSVETVRRVVAVSGLIEDLDGQLKDGMAVELSIYPGTARQ